jgi:hypothetical protein
MIQTCQRQHSTLLGAVTEYLVADQVLERQPPVRD